MARHPRREHRPDQEVVAMGTCSGDDQRDCKQQGMKAIRHEPAFLAAAVVPPDAKGLMLEAPRALSNLKHLFPEWPRMVQVSNKGPAVSPRLKIITVSPRLKIILELLPSLVAALGTVPLFSLTLCLHHEWVLQRVLQRGPIP